MYLCSCEVKRILVQLKCTNNKQLEKFAIANVLQLRGHATSRQSLCAVLAIKVEQILHTRFVF